MEKYTGKSIFKGIAIGKILFYQKGEQPVKRVKIEDTAEQIKRYEDARAKAAEQLQGLYEKALKEVGEANAAVFEVHQMMLEDDDYIDSVVNIIETQQVNAEFAVATTGDNFAKMFAEMEDDYFKSRAADVKDISERMVNNVPHFEDSVTDATFVSSSQEQSITRRCAIYFLLIIYYRLRTYKNS